MIEITFILPNGGQKACTAGEGLSLMEVALQNSVPGVVAECNGAAACGTCHVIVDDILIDILDSISDHENDMLDFTNEPREPGSRLSCQIRIDGRLNGAVVRVASEM